MRTTFWRSVSGRVIRIAGGFVLVGVAGYFKWEYALPVLFGGAALMGTALGQLSGADEEDAPVSHARAA